MTTIHLGDCSSGCVECGLRCVGANHADCIGTAEERATAETAFESLTDAQRAEYSEIVETDTECAFEEFVREIGYGLDSRSARD